MAGSRDFITSPYDPDVEQVKSWLEAMVKAMRFTELIVAVLAFVVRLRDINTELMRRLMDTRRKRPPSERLAALERQLVLPLPGLEAPQQPTRQRKRKGSRRRRRDNHPGRRPFPAHLERVKQPNAVPPGLRHCPHPGCQTPLEVVGHETSESLDIRPAELIVVVREDECLKCPDHGTVISAPPPPRIVPKGKLSDTLIIEAVADKFLLHLPIERQCARWAQYGVELSPQTLGRSVAVAIDLLGPLASAILEQARANDLASIDATSIRLLDEEAPEGIRTGTMWCCIGGPWAAFFYSAKGDGDSVRRLLADELAKTIQCDGTLVTNCIERAGGKRPGCWGHGRRRFAQAARGGDTLALEGLRIIRKLFAVDRLSKLKRETYEQRHARRQVHSVRVLDQLRHWLDEHRGRIPPKTPLGRALGYLHRQWDRLTLFLEDGRIELTNNHVEREIRRLVIGRKNWLFVYEDVGGERVARILTIIGTCIAHGVNPRKYLHEVTRLLVRGWPADQMRDLLPDRLAERMPELLMPVREQPDEAASPETIAELEALLADDAA